MALRSPLVIGNDGLPQQLQPGDTISAPTNTPSIRAVTNGESSAALVFGTPVYPSASDTVKRGQANAKATSGLVGLSIDGTIAAGATGNIAEDGTVVGTTAQWDAVTGASGGLTFNMLYFLDAATPGKLTSTPPTTAGQVNMLVGRAISATALALQIREPILL